MRKTLFIFFIAILTLSLFISCEGDIDSALEAKITVTFDGNGSTDGEMAALKVKKGEDFKLTKNAFEKTDYIFTGWNTAADGSGTAYANEGTAKFDKDTILYAQWIEELTITFDGNGSTGGEMAALKVKKGEDFKLTKNAFEKTNYIFTGWNTADDGSGTAYANEGTAKFDKDTTLYAQWSEELTITFNANDDSGTPATKTQKVGKGIATALDANTFTRTSYYFAGWSSSASGDVEYADKANIILTGDKILYAVWSVNPVVTLTKGTGISEVTGSGSYAPGAVVTINATVADGYTWSKWTQTTGGADVSTTKEYSFTMGTENINYTANATANTYTVTLETNGGTIATGKDVTSYTYGVGATLPTASDITKSGSSFGGWYANSEYTGDAVTSISTTDTGDKIFYAKWIEELTITFNANGGTPATKTQKVGKGIATALDANTFTFEGHYFAGWSFSAGGVVEYADKANITLTEDKILYAVWSDNPVVTLTKGTGISEVTGAGSYAPGDNVSLDATMSDGYKWSKWTQTTGGADVSTIKAYSFEMGTQNIAYTANAEPISYSVAFDKNSESATGTMTNQSFTYDVAQNLTANAYSWESHSFTGWNTSADGTGTSYTDGQSVENLSATDGATVTLYAQWLEEVTITFKANGGTGDDKTQVVVKDVETALAANSFTSPEADKIFAGWTTGSDGSGTYYGDKESVTLTENITLYAQWGIALNNLVDKYDWKAGKTYTITDNLTLEDNRVTANGTSKLFLASGKTLTVSKGITVNGGNSLTINGDGSLIAGGTETPSYSAGIGSGNGGGAGGTVTINGGNVTATGGQYGAGIGGGSGDGGTVTINGGNVTATGGQYGAGIGGGALYDGGTVNINGGIVTANGGANAAGIGGGEKGAGGNVTITRGNVDANGGSDGGNYGFAIGKGYNADSKSQGSLSVTGSNLKVYGDNSTNPPTTECTDYGTTRYRYMDVK